MPADLENRIRAGARRSEPPAPGPLWARGRARRTRRTAAVAVASVVIVAGLAVGLARSSGRHDGVSIYTDDPTTTYLPPPSTIDTSGPGWTTVTDTDAGFTVDVPPGWSATTDPLTGLTDPVERFTAASYPLRVWDGNPDHTVPCDVVLPAAVVDAGPTDAFATIQERVVQTFPPDATAPATSQHVLGDGSFESVPSRADLSCASRQNPGADARWIWFSAAGRSFYLAVVVGPDASPATRQQLWAMLDSFRPS